MLGTCLFLAAVVGFQDSRTSAKGWGTFTSREGNFVIDLPRRPTKTYTRTQRSRSGQMTTSIVECETPDVLYIAEKVDLPGTIAKLSAADADAIQDEERDSLAAEFHGKVIAQKNLRLDTGAFGRDYTIEGRLDRNDGLVTIRVRQYLSNKVIYVLIAAGEPDQELPEDVGRFFASFSPGTRRIKKVGPLPEIAGTRLGSWGMAIDPDRDCKIEDRGKSLEISIPNTHHDLNADNNKLNSPRVVRELTGDFTMTVKVSGDFTPSTQSTNPKAIPYIGAGILVWRDSDNYIFLGRAGINRGGRINEFAAFEEREWGTRGALNNRVIPSGDAYLRLERRNNRILGSISKDGRTWSRLDPMEPTYPSTLKVGLYAINGCTKPITVTFDHFSVSQGKSSASAKKRR